MMSYQLLMMKTDSIYQSLLDELHNLDADSAVIFCQKVEPIFKILSQNREYFVQVKRIYLMHIFEVPPHKSAYGVENIFIENRYNYDPHNPAFKFGEWWSILKLKL